MFDHFLSMWMKGLRQSLLEMLMQSYQLKNSKQQKENVIRLSQKESF